MLWLAINFLVVEAAALAIYLWASLQSAAGEAVAPVAEAIFIAV